MALTIIAPAYGGPDVLRAVDVAVPDPGPGEITVRVRAVGLNPIDHKRFGGLMGADPAALPLRVGSELAGVVTAVGPDATGRAGALRVGDEVVAHPVTGALAQLTTIPAAVAAPKPAELDWAPAAGLLLTGATALHALTATAVTKGDTVLVHGASGGVGQLAVQLAVADGATVLGTASPARHDLLRELGAIPLAHGPGLADRVRAAAAQGVDAAIDTIGTDEAVDVSLDLVADRSRIATIAAFRRADTGIRALGGGPNADPGTAVRADAWRRLLPEAASGALRVTVAATFPLEQAADAYRLLAGGHAGGKIVVLP